MGAWARYLTWPRWRASLATRSLTLTLTTGPTPEPNLNPKPEPKSDPNPNPNPNPDPDQIRKSNDKNKYGGDLDFLNEQIWTRLVPSPSPNPSPNLNPNPNPNSNPDPNSSPSPSPNPNPNLNPDPNQACRQGLADGPRRLLLQQVPQLAPLPHATTGRLPARRAGLRLQIQIVLVQMILCAERQTLPGTDRQTPGRPVHTSIRRAYTLYTVGQH